MKSKKLKIVKGSGNVFRDLGHKHADADQFKAILAAEIIKVLDRDGLSVRGAQGRTGIAAADFSRIRNADLGRFTVDRLISIMESARFTSGSEDQSAALKRSNMGCLRRVPLPSTRASSGWKLPRRTG